MVAHSSHYFVENENLFLFLSFIQGLYCVTLFSVTKNKKKKSFQYAVKLGSLRYL